MKSLSILARLAMAGAGLLAAGGAPLGAQTKPGPALTCLLVPERVSDIGSDQNGIVIRIMAHRTDTVAAGQVLLQLDDRTARADLERALVMRDAVRERLVRAEALSQNNVIPQDQIKALRVEAALANADADKAALMVERTAIRAPFDGTIADLQAEEGELTGHDPLLRLISTRHLHVELEFPSEAFGLIHPGDSLHVAVSDQGLGATATVTTTDPFIDPASGSFLVVASLDNPAGQYSAGASCSLK